MDHQMMLILEEKWEHLLRKFEIEQARAQESFGTLAEMYGSAGRVYHTLEHILDMLAWLERLEACARDLPVVQLATWFHDCVYDSHASDNEEQSALHAQRVLASFALSETTIQAVSRLILSTKTHQVGEAGLDGELLLDADLAILGAPAPAYDAYARAIREEYAWVPETTYKTARGQILQTFLQRPRIYLTSPMHTILEAQARGNLLREILALS